ncbi:MAG: hypothetical protein ACYSUF_03535 [Planctomycetota bacterium]
MSEGGPARGSPVRGPCPGDLDGDGVVGIIDFPTALGTRGLCHVVEPSRGGERSTHTRSGQLRARITLRWARNRPGRTAP